MRPARSSIVLLTPFLMALACGLPAAVEGPGESDVPSDAPTQAPAGLPNATAADKWSLWSGETGTQLRGANLWQRIVVPELDGPEFLGDGYIGPPVVQSDFDALASLGANYVNLSHPGLFTERAPYELDEGAQANLDRLIEMASRADLFVVITFRTGPGRSDFTFYRDGAGDWFDPELLVETVWTDPAAQEAWAEMWRYTAERYRHEPVVVGYDLMCEPNSNTVLFDLYEPEEYYPQYAGDVSDWNEFYPHVVEAIREVDRETPILVAGMGWSAVRWLDALQPTDDPRSVYMVHQYEPQGAYTHQSQGDPTIPAGNGYPGEFDLDGDGQPDVFDREWLERLLMQVDDFESKHQKPVAVNEFGVERWAPGAADFLRDEIEAFEERGMNHAIWAWNPDWAPWIESSNGMNYLFGPDPSNVAPVENEVLSVLIEAWSRNAVRPSTFVREAGGGPAEDRRASLGQVSNWLFLIGENPHEQTVARIAASDYDLVVLDFAASQVGGDEALQAATLAELDRAGRWVLAYIDIGQAETSEPTGNPTGRSEIS